MVRDTATGGSPTGSAGRLGEEDYFDSFNVFAFGGNLLFYGAVVWLLGQLPHVFRSTTARRVWVRMFPALVFVGAGLLIGFLSYRPSAAWHPPPATAPPTVALLGTWRGLEPVSGAPILVRFYDDQQVIWSLERDGGGSDSDYRWVDDRTIQVHFVDYLPNTIDMCARLPVVFVSACRAQLDAPTATSLPLQPNTVDANASPTPTLSPDGTVVRAIDVLVTLRVAVDQTTLTLQPPSGRVQTLQRVTGE
jgi:hypothetical protein